ncbi:IS66 family insertion sequence element accessory protein TnpA [Leptospira adleri]|uniref:IS66 family insertion sequence element accessory protein TnpB n=1 Tax=Leptospira adleri TaxID=2023186 RepID=A0A2M9YI51_9LEPT|nr:hypothetical protein [Leptospira adleri]PJZ51196.1 hypothetical protein CH380_21365 [Leptospira adleri]PJZ59436.1 hypothetical protein CH376_23745 [Leptospira adleri]
MKKSIIDWQKEFDSFSKSGLSQPQYCKEKGIKYTTFRYHWERRLDHDKDGFVEVSDSDVNVSSPSGSEFLTLKVDSTGKVHLQMNLHFSLGIWS